MTHLLFGKPILEDKVSGPPPHSPNAASLRVRLKRGPLPSLQKTLPPTESFYFSETLRVLETGKREATLTKPEGSGRTAAHHSLVSFQS